MRTFRIWVAIVMLCWAGSAWADCLPSGRPTFVKGVDALSRGDLTAARQAFEDLVKGQPECAEARNNLAVVLVEQGDIAAAADQLRRALEIRSDYQRARLNLERVQTMLAARQQANPPPQPTLEVEAHVQPTAAPAQAEATEPTAAPVAAAPPAPVAAAPALPPPPPALAALDPQGASASVVDLSAHRVCVYQRGADGIVANACYSVTGLPGTGGAAWLVASDLNDHRIRLVDVSGEKRLRVVPAGASGSDTLQLAPADFTALSKMVVPWRTGWLVLAGTSTPPSAAQAAADGVRDALDHWRQAWEGKKFDEYAGFYSPSFVPQDSNLARWKARKRDLFAESGSISVQLAAPSVFVVDQGATVLTSFEQKYHSKITTSRCVKVLRWQRQGDRWQITAETVLSEES